MLSRNGLLIAICDSSRRPFPPVKSSSVSSNRVVFSPEGKARNRTLLSSSSPIPCYPSRQIRSEPAAKHSQPSDLGIAMQLIRPRLAISHLMNTVAMAALLLVLLRWALQTEANAVLSVIFLSPLVLSPFFMFLSPQVMGRIFRAEALIALPIFAICLLVNISAGRGGSIGAALIDILCIWLTTGFGYGYMASIAWSRRTGRMQNDAVSAGEEAEGTIPPDGSPLGPGGSSNLDRGAILETRTLTAAAVDQTMCNLYPPIED
jgi:hypothetical protein